MLQSQEGGGMKMTIPKHEIESLARCLLPELHKFFASEEGKQELKKWKEQQEKQLSQKQK